MSNTQTSSQPALDPKVSDDPQAIYNTLINFFSTHACSVLELEILPSFHSTPSQSTAILHDGLSLAVTKKALVRAFLVAREVFLSRPSLTSTSDASTDRKKSILEVLAATKTILLYDPEHLSAANWRKRYLTFRETRGNEKDEVQGRLRRAVEEEMKWTQSLVTSPLNKHAKSPTLWFHRLWLVKNYHSLILHPDPAAADALTAPLSTAPITLPPLLHRSKTPPGRDAVLAFLQTEIDIILQAAAQHKANYHAFHYGRRLLAFLSQSSPSQERSRADNEKSADKERGSFWFTYRELGELVEVVRRWCFAHPRDVSGWGFLACLLTNRGAGGDGEPGEEGERDEEGEGEDDGHDGGAEWKGVRAGVVAQTRGFVQALGWTGDSVAWFLREMDRVGT
ncbi:hypothetical protein MMC19_005011 [Ptychographa xylographoides]|nr:hypothetical protein [Ptychographa xylographoides]